jgi:uncharacterized protein (DUF169 family)
MYRQMAERYYLLLNLDAPPVAITFAEDVAAEIPVAGREVPSACSFWRQAESGTFYPPAVQHFNCSIGAMTMGFELSQAVRKQLTGVVEKMTECGYLALEEADKIPSVRKRKVGIVYGPLEKFQMAPDLVLMWLNPKQAMLYAEAVGKCPWTENVPTAVFGRPACAALPLAFEGAQPTLSLGCTGMRTFTDISEDRLLAVVPGEKAGDPLEALELTVEANSTMGTFYQEHRSKFIG